MLFIHIGLHKTGSSSLQEWLTHNAARLSTSGVDYVEIGRGRGPTAFAHHALASDSALDPGGLWDRLRQTLDAEPERRVVVSSENFSLLRPEVIAAIAARIGSHRVQVLVYLRPLESTIPAAYNQVTRYGLNLDDIDRYFVRSVDSPFWWQPEDGIRAWIDAFGAEQVRVRTLGTEPGCVDLMPDALATLGLSAAQCAALDSAPRANPSWHWKTVETLRSIFSQLDDRVTREGLKPPNGIWAPYRRMAEAANAVAPQLGWRDDLIPYLDPHQVQRCREREVEIHRRLALWLGTTAIVDPLNRPVPVQRSDVPRVGLIPPDEVSHVLGAVMLAWAAQREREAPG